MATLFNAKLMSPLSASAALAFGVFALGAASPVRAETFSTPGEYSYVAPTTGVYDITAFGAQGGGGGQGPLCSPANGCSPGVGGLGAEIGGSIHLTAGTTLTVIVGGQGAFGSGVADQGGGGGGGGGSFVFLGAQPLVVAGGGGGAGGFQGPLGFGSNGGPGGVGGAGGDGLNSSIVGGSAGSGAARRAVAAAAF